MRVHSTPTVFQPVTSLDYPLFTDEGLAISLILLAPIALNILRERHEASVQT